MTAIHRPRKSNLALKEQRALVYEQLRLNIGEQTRGWDFAKEDTQYSTHGLHTYLAAMNPPLARRLIQAYVPKKGSILDPFCGGGAVLVESVLHNHDTVGRDVNSLAVMISRAKTTFIDKNDVLTTGKGVLAEARDYRGEPLHFTKSDNVHLTT